METIKYYTNKYLLSTILTILAVDFFGFMLWTLMDQVPVGGFYIGAITERIIKLALGAV